MLAFFDALYLDEFFIGQPDLYGTQLNYVTINNVAAFLAFKEPDSLNGHTNDVLLFGNNDFSHGGEPRAHARQVFVNDYLGGVNLQVGIEP